MRRFSTYVKKFFKTASVQEKEGKFLVALDSRILKTPKKHTLELPSYLLALNVATEWESQGEFIKPFAMPLVPIT